MSKKILIVEDSEIVGVHLRKVLERSNYTILGILRTGEEAINFIQKKQADLVLMDVILEGKYDGIETSIEINKIKDIPVIYLTALNDKKTFDRAKITFPYTFLSKPFAESELLSNVELSLYKHHADQLNRESQELVSTILDNIKSCVMVVDKDYQIKYVNKYTAKLLHTLPEIINGFTLGSDISVSDWNGDPLSPNLLAELSTSQTQQETIVYIHFAGRKFPINNILVTQAKFYKQKNKQYLLMFNDAKEAIKHIEAKKERERNKLIAQIKGTETERSRISKELHDGLGQMLNVIKMRTKAKIGDPAIKEELIELIDKSIEESHKISDNLMPSKLQMFDLKSSLEDLIESYEHSPLTIAFCTNIKDGSMEEVKINFYRIIQEALHNIEKHAEAKNVSIQMYENNYALSLSIEDDGKGFDVKKIRENIGKNKSHGILNMIDRVKSMDGTIDIDSSANFGTNINIQLTENA